MLKPTVQLFIKALIIGVLVDLTVQQLASMPLTVETSAPYRDYQSLNQEPVKADFHVSDLNQQDK
jgi:hypothetical protein